VSERDVPFVTVEWEGSESDLDAASGTWKVGAARTTLSAEGSDAFGTYPEGEEMDPLSFCPHRGTGVFRCGDCGRAASCRSSRGRGNRSGNGRGYFSGA